MIVVHYKCNKIHWVIFKKLKKRFILLGVGIALGLFCMKSLYKISHRPLRTCLKMRDALQGPYTSLNSVENTVVDNRLVLDCPLAERGKFCTVPNKPCHTLANNSGQIEVNMKGICKQAQRLQDRPQKVPIQAPSGVWSNRACWFNLDASVSWPTNCH